VVGGGLPAAPIQAEMRAMGLKPPLPPSFEASRLEVLRALWSAAGLEDIATREIVVSRSFTDFDDFWTTNLLGASLAQVVATMPGEDVDRLKARLRANAPTDSAGRVTHSARANAIKGRVR
jgi:hypothetical protein